MIVKSVIQSCIVFIFLTVFFFSYVSSVEKEEFNKQLDYITDNIFEEHKSSIIFPENKKEITKIAIYGLIDNAEKQIEISNKDKKKEIDSINQQIIRNSIYLVLLYTGISIIFLIVLHFCKFELNIVQNLKEGFFILFFVFLVEFLFLNIIAKNYIEGNSNLVINKVCTNIIRYINDRP